MSKRTLGTAAIVVAVASAVPAIGSAAGTSTTRTTSPKIDILGGDSFVPNRYVQDRLRFAKDVYVLKSGTQITITSKTPGPPHTLSVVRKSDFPKTARGLHSCFAPGSICDKLFGAHGFPEGEGPPATPLVNVGAKGFDKAGDSIVIGPEAPNNKATVKLTAKKGTALFFMCVLHPQMQAKIVVK